MVEEPLDDLDPARQRRALQQPSRERGALDDVGNLDDERCQLVHLAALGQEHRLLHRPGADAAGGDPLRAVSRRPRRRSSRLAIGVDEHKGHCSGPFEDAGSVAFSGHRVAQRAAEMVEPPLGDRPGDGQVLVVLIQRAPSRLAVARWSAEPFGKESLLPVAAVRQVPAEERSDHGVGLEAVVEGVHEPVDGGLSTDAVEQATVLERPKAGCELQEATMAHVRVDAQALAWHASTL